VEDIQYIETQITTGCVAKIDLYLTALEQARQFTYACGTLKSPLSKEICLLFSQF
jgi:hypothetical protein